MRLHSREAWWKEKATVKKTEKHDSTSQEGRFGATEVSVNGTKKNWC